MEILRWPMAALYLAAAVLGLLGARLERGRVPAFLGGLSWAAGTVCALVEGAGLDELLCATLALLLVSTGLGRRRAART